MHPFPVRQGLHLNFFEFWFSSVILWPDLQLKFPTFKNPRFQNEQRENEFYFCMGIKNHFHINGFSSRKKKKETWGSGRSNLPIVPEACSFTVI